MECEAAREAISALLDGEHPGVERSALDAHLASCAACRFWREEAHALTRRARLASATAVPSAGASLMVTLREAERRRRWWRSLALTRGGLALVAVGQLVVTIPPLLFGTDHEAPIHVAHELGAFDMALAVGFLAAALRPSRARGMRTLVGCAALLLVVTAAIDLVAGRTTASDEWPHLLAVVGWLLLWRISELAPTSADEPAFSLLAPVRSAARSLRPAGREGEAVGIAVPPGTERKQDDPGVEPAAEAEPSSALMAETG
jgi:predicted anti-sigma-YlaC factor YlaD